MKALASFHYFRTVDFVDLCSVYSGPVQLFGDSGAFSAMSQGAAISLDDYATWIERWARRLAVYANLDVIGDPAATAANQAALERRGLHPLPVFHVGSPLAELERLCERYAYIALGGMVGRNNLGAWLVRCFRIAEKHGAHFHGFGLTRMDLARDFPFYSVDSASWSAGVRYGRLFVWDDDRALFAHADVGNKRSVLEHSDLIRAHGCDPLKLATRARYDRTEAITLCGVAWQKFGVWLARRHGDLQLRDGSRPAGPHLYLAQVAGDWRHLLHGLNRIETRL